MPELPEVETVIRYLNTKIDNLKILKVDVIRAKFLKNVSESQFITSVVNRKIINVSRFGKNIIFNLDGDAHIVSHLRMEGRWYVVDDEFVINERHTHLVFYLENHQKLCYVDTRQFGTIDLYLSSEAMWTVFHKKCGLDALDEKCDSEYLYQCFHKTTLPIKVALLEQSKIMGIGNIYANEICFALNLHPTTPFNTLPRFRYDELCCVMKNILKSAIEQNGTTVHSFEFNINKSGDFQNELVVYGHDKKPCQVCNTNIEKIALRQRGTYFCPKCQRYEE